MISFFKKDLLATKGRSFSNEKSTFLLFSQVLFFLSSHLFALMTSTVAELIVEHISLSP